MARKLLIFIALFLLIGMASLYATTYESLSFNSSDLNGNAILGTTDTGFTPTNEGFMSTAYIKAKSLSNRVGFDSTTTVGGVPFTLQSIGSNFNGNDSITLSVSSSGSNATFNLKKVGAYKDLYILATMSGPGNDKYADFSVKLTFTDGSTKTYTYKLYDWCYRSLSATNVSTKSLTKTASSNGSITSKASTVSNWNALVQSYHISGIEKTKLIKSITFTFNGLKYISSGSSVSGGGSLRIFAITGIAADVKPPTISLTSVSGTTAKIGWSAVTGASSYRLDVSTDSDFTSILSSYNNKNIGNVTSYSITGLTAGSTYYARVRAVNSSSEQSVSSNVITIPIHKHVYNYSASGTTLTCYCSGTVGTSQCGCNGTANKVTVSISVPDTVHYGASYTPYSSTTKWSQLGLAAITASYTGRNSTTYSSSTAPTAIGDYKLTLTISGQSKSVSKNFSIKHYWSYSKSGDAIIAKCSTSGCKYNTTPISLKIAVPDFVHVGASYTELTNESTWNGAGCSAITKLYTGTMEEAAYSSSTAPKKRGNFTFKVTAASLSLTKEFEINHVWTYTDDGFDIFAHCTYEDCQYHTTPVEVTLATNIADMDLAVEPLDSETSVTWTSSNPEVATINEDGLLKSVSSGSTTVTAILNDGSGYYDKAKITVLQAN